MQNSDDPGRLILPVRACCWLRRLWSTDNCQERRGQLHHQRLQDVSWTKHLQTATDSIRWITNSGEAETFLVFANVDPSAGYKGITCFVMSKDMGVQIAKKERKLGIRSSSTCLLNFDDVIVPKENIVGELGKASRKLHHSESSSHV